MRVLICVLLSITSLCAQQALAPPAQAEVHPWEPGSSSFYINGVAYRFIAGTGYAIVAAATPAVAGKYFGVKVHVFNRSHRSITIRPDDFIVVDALANRRMEPISAIEVANRKRGQPGWVKFVDTAMAGPTMGGEAGGDPNHPQWSDLVRALQPQVNSSINPLANSAVYSKQNLQEDGPDCDTACQLRNREVNSTLSSGWQSQNIAESIERTAFLANTIPPQCDIEGVLYFPMPKLASTDAAARRRSKSYAITITVPMGGERFHLDFPVE